MGYRVIALVRKGSQAKIPDGAEIIVANPFDATSFQLHIPLECIFVQLLVFPILPQKRTKAAAFDLETIYQMVRALVNAVKAVPQTVKNYRNYRY